MDAAVLTAAVQAQMAARGGLPLPPPPGGPQLRFGGPGDGWLFGLAADQAEPEAYLHAFEAALQRLLTAAGTGAGEQLGLALAFGSTAAGEPRSYRRALKKYSRSVIFEDLSIHLWLFLTPGELIELAPAAVGPFLQDLNRWIAARKAA